MSENKADPLREALQTIADHPENFDDGTSSYSVGWAFWNVQKIAKAALAAPQPSVPLGGREAVALTIQNFAASILAIEDDEIVNVGPFSFACADATLAAIPQESGVDRAAIERLQDNVQRIDQCLDNLNWRPSRAHLEGARNTMQNALAAITGDAGNAATPDRAAIVEECAKVAEDYPIPTGTDHYTSGFGDATNFIAEAIRALGKETGR